MTKRDYHDYLNVVDGQLIYRNGKVLGDVYKEVDGFYVFWPTGVGAWDAATLAMIALLLDDMNLEWDAEIKAFFEEEGKSGE